MSSLPKQSSDATTSSQTNAFFDGYYKVTFPINGQQYDAVLTFFLKKTSNNKIAAEALTATLMVLAQKRGIDPISILNEFKNYNNDENFKAVLLSLLNSDRGPTSKLGFAVTPQANSYVIRNIGR